MRAFVGVVNTRARGACSPVEQVVGNCGQLTVGVAAMEVGGATGGEGVAKGEMGGAFGEKQPMDQVVD